MATYIHITINTEKIKEKHPKPSQDSNSPTLISHTNCYMVGNNDVLYGNGTGELNLQMPVGNLLHVYGSSASSNFEDSILLYTITHLAGPRIFEFQGSNQYEADGLVPSGTDTLPGDIIRDTTFNFLELTVVSGGMELHGLSFALYDTDNFGKPHLFGYFQSAVLISNDV